jgi:hypothetical protein
MTRWILAGWLAAALVAAGGSEPAAPPAQLTYSGDDVAAGPGTLTIRCAAGDMGLWELDLVRPKKGRDLRIKRFDDLTDRGDFNYAPGTDNQQSLFVVHHPARVVRGSLTELHKGADYYGFSLREAYSNCMVVTAYRIGAADGDGTRIVARRTLVNTSGKPMAPLPTSMMSARMTLAVGPYDGRRAGARCELTPYDEKGRRHHRQPRGKDALWTVTDNVCRDKSPTFDPAQPLWAEGEVKRSAAARGLGLVPGRTFRLASDVVAYYPASTIGGIVLQQSADYLDGLLVAMTPREWFGRQRKDHNEVGLPADGAVTKTFALEVNIKAK